MVRKELVQDRSSKRIKWIQFGVLSAAEIAQLSEVEVWQRDLYDVSVKAPATGGVLDMRLGIANKDRVCETCGKRLSDCAGHFGFIKLALPCFHAGYFKATITLLQQICKSCSRVMLEEKERRSFLHRLRTPRLENPQKMKIIKQINTLCRKFTDCPHCGALNGVVKKVGAMKIVHERYRTKAKENEQTEFRNTFKTAIQHMPELKQHLPRAQDDLNPLRVMELFVRISAEDCELLGLDPLHGRPEQFLWSVIPVSPVCIRPSVAMDRGEMGSNEDDLTVKLAEILTVNQFIEQSIQEGDSSHKLAEDWEFLQIVCAQLVNSEMPGLSAATNAGKWIRGLCQRLKGKQGRFRGNLSGKRVDFSGRTVISPDPNLRIDQVAVPDHVAKLLTYPEMVNDHNRSILQQAIINGPDIHPGANYIARGEIKRFLKFVSDRKQAAKELKNGDVVERHLRDGDVVLFNRQPSLHKLSIMAHYAKIRPWRTFRFNECVCTPYNADFDGDEMNLHVPQTEEARVEAIQLMGTKQNLVTPRNGQPLIAATQDFITCAYLITRKDRFFNRAEFCQIVGYMFDNEEHIDLPPPVIIKPMRLWTGKQVFNILMRPNLRCPVKINLETKTRSFVKNPLRSLYQCPNDGYLVVRNSELMSGVVDKSIVGDGTKSSIFYVALRDFGCEEAAKCMNRLAKLSARWMANYGFSIGIEDVSPGARLSQLRDDVIQRGYVECDDLIDQHRRGVLRCQPGCNMDQTLEAQISGKLSKIRDDLGQICLEELDSHNAALVMSMCGSKGSKINVCQMVACVGQQIINGNRIADGFDNRTLPHFPKHSRTPAAKGFVRNSFFTGLSPTEFIFHAASGREGLVDTAVKTAETGYMQRRLVKALEDLAIHYDYSVRNSNGIVVQFDYGNDRLDPTMMEGDECPVEFYRCLQNALTSYPRRPTERTLNAEEIPAVLERVKCKHSMETVCSAGFLEIMEKFLNETVTKRIAGLRKKYGPPMSEKSGEGVSFGVADHLMSITEIQLESFVLQCKTKYHRASIEPGTAVGALGAQSIGEPGTQMTLKTFHFAGVASMNVTMGVPRIKEIINASKVINTPIIAAKLVSERSETAARIVKGRIETTLLGDVAEYIEEVVRSDESFIEIKIDQQAIQALQLEVDLGGMCNAIVQAPKLKVQRQQMQQIGNDIIRVFLGGQEAGKMFYRMQTLKRALPNVVIKGISSILRAVINEQECKSGTYELLAEGYGLREVMNTDGIVGRETTTNHIMEMEKVLGIEAARSTICGQIQYTMGKHGMSIDHRHVMLLADIMTFKGEVLGITRFGIAKMKDSVLMLASFEKTTDHLFDAALYGKKDAVEGVSECIIMGIPMPIGTGLFKVMYQVDAKPARSSKTDRRAGGRPQDAVKQAVQDVLVFDDPILHRPRPS